MIEFSKATKTKAKLRMAIIGPSGSGKTYTALTLACALGGKVALMDTEHGSASKYADLFDFDTFEPDSFHPNTYIDAVAAASNAGYEVLIIDSLSHAWTGKDGALELVDREAAKSKSGNSFAAWRNITPLHNQLIDAMIGANLHIIATMRSKVEYIQTQDDRGRTVIKKVGMQPVQRDGMEYEFDIVADMDMDNNLIVGKSRCPILAGVMIAKPNEELAHTLSAWLSDGGEPIKQPDPPKRQPQTPRQPAPPKKGNGNGWNPIQILIDCGACPDGFSAQALVNNYVPKEVLTGHDTEALKTWGLTYRAWKDSNPKMDTTEAANHATAGIAPE